LQSLVVLVGMSRFAEPDGDQMVPETLPRLTADTLRRLQGDPMWSLWGDT